VAGAHRQNNSESGQAVSLADLLGQPVVPRQRQLDSPGHHSPRRSPAGRRWLSRRSLPGRWWLLAGAVVVLMAIGAVMIAAHAHAPARPRLALTVSRVAIGHSYFATATGFRPGEPIRFSWTGPTNGVMGTFPADSTGARTHGPILERDPVGSYQIIVTGLASGQVTSTPLQVMPPG
jgi:hypothetical protein